MDDTTRTLNFAAPAGYDPGLAMPEPAAKAEPRLTGFLTDTGQTADLGASATSLLTAAKKVDYLPIGMGEIAATIMIGLAWRYLRGAPARVRAIALDEPSRPSWLPADDQAQRIAFEARYNGSSRR